MQKRWLWQSRRSSRLSTGVCSPQTRRKKTTTHDMPPPQGRLCVSSGPIPHASTAARLPKRRCLTSRTRSYSAIGSMEEVPKTDRRVTFDRTPIADNARRRRRYRRRRAVDHHIGFPNGACFEPGCRPRHKGNAISVYMQALRLICRVHRS